MALTLVTRFARAAMSRAGVLLDTGRAVAADVVKQGRAAAEAARTEREVVVPGPDVEEPPTAEEIAEAAEAHEVAREAYNLGSRGKRAARKILDRTPTGEYLGWAVSWVQSSRREWDRDAIAAVFAELGREIPTKAAAPTLKVTRVETEAPAETADELLAA